METYMCDSLNEYLIHDLSRLIIKYIPQYTCEWSDTTIDNYLGIPVHVHSTIKPLPLHQVTFWAFQIGTEDNLGCVVGVKDMTHRKFISLYSSDYGINLRHNIGVAKDIPPPFINGDFVCFQMDLIRGNLFTSVNHGPLVHILSDIDLDLELYPFAESGFSSITFTFVDPFTYLGKRLCLW